MKIDKKLLSELCDLACLKITPEEERQLQVNLTEILSHFEKISEADSRAASPLASPLRADLPMREDKLKDFPDKTACLNQTPHREGRLFKTVSVL